MPTMTAPVSVVIPCFRCASTIRRSVQSVADQTMRPSEVILVDDDSGDGTLESLRRIQEEFGRNWVKVLTTGRNSGPSAARNLAWDNATCDYLGFLDADDAWHRKKIEIQYGWMRTHSDVVLTGHTRAILLDGMTPPPVSERPQARRLSPLRWLLSNQCSTPTVMVRRDIRFRFSEQQRFAEDYLLWLQIALGGNPCYFLELPLAFIFKPPYGARGLSADLWSMEKGELSTYRRLYRDGMISSVGFSCLAVYSLAKYSYRWGGGRRNN